MIFNIKHSLIPLEIKIIGDINEIEYAWKVAPFIKHIEEDNLHRFLLSFKGFLNWTYNNDIICQFTAPFKYKLALFFLQ